MPYLLEPLIPLHTVIVGSPDVLVLLPPAAHQIGAYMHVGTAPVASDKMASADIEKPHLMAMTAFDITEELTDNEVAQPSF